MKHIGIFLNRDLKMNAGGPSGYLYNLKLGLDEFENNIQFFTKESSSNTAGTANVKIKKHSSVYSDFRLAISYILKGKKVKKKIDPQIYKMDCIHVHASEDLWALKAIIGYKGKIVFTPHRPETLANEVITTQQLLNDTTYSFPILKRVCNFIEAYSYKNADAFIFPSKGAAKIYEQFPGFEKYALNKPMEFVYTGTRDVNVTANIYDYAELKKDEKTMFVYVGRHNYIKGYDLLVDAFQHIDISKSKFICAGAQSNIVPPNSKDWIELGYIKNANSLMKAANCVVIPNRNTYFDLVIIEALSVGAIIITSATGGNVDLAKDTEGLILFESGKVESLNKAISTFLGLSDEEKIRMKNSNRMLYETRCSIECFAKAYNIAINKLAKII